MKVWGKQYFNNQIKISYAAESALDDPSDALMDCLEQIYKHLDMAEPVWVTKHARELSVFRKTKFLPADFLEPVKFDFFEIELLAE